jgi:GNAT superfamily N-acetyltransferase
VAPNPNGLPIFKLTFFYKEFIYYTHNLLGDLTSRCFNVRPKKNGAEAEMGQITISFKTKPLESCVALTKKIDKLCFPNEMWLSGEELHLLTLYNAEATILTINGQPIGQAITLPEIFAAQIIADSDPDFQTNLQGVYSYSEAIIPSHQKLGYGALLLHEIALRMKQRGFISISAHVRTRFGWNVRRRKTLQVSDDRLLYDFWDDELEVVQYQRAYL